MHRNAGFTLLEVMVVVVIIGILATIGYPAYTDYIRRGKIAEAISTLSDTRTKMEQFFLDNRTYVGSDAATMPCNAAVLAQGKKQFTYLCSNLGVGTYTVTATGVGAEGMGAFAYVIDQANARSSTVTGLSGWSSNTTCWVVKKGGVC
ncbi:MAG: type IV pilin protein [Burkholderiales bacterium]